MKVVIIGAGLTGIGAAHYLQSSAQNGRCQYILLEKCDRPGGLCKTEQDRGFLFDYTGHLLHFRTAYFKNLVKSLLASRLVRQERNARIFSHGVYTRYPFQGHLHGLPTRIVLVCLTEYFKAALKRKKRPIETFEEWIIKNFGSGIAEHFMIPYNHKLYKRHPREMAADAAGGFAPKPDFFQVLKGAFSPSDSHLGYNSFFYYPESGGIEALVQALIASINPIRVNESVVEIDLVSKNVTTSNGFIYPYDTIISTIPIPDLVHMLNGGIPDAVIEAAESLSYVSVLNINLGLKGRLDEKHWIYVPEDRFIFYRVGFPSNFSENMAPQGYSSIYTEVSYQPEGGIDRSWAKGRVISDLIDIGVIHRNQDIELIKIIDIPYAYVIYNEKRVQSLATIHGFLEDHDIVSAGRFGAWKYMSMEDSFVEGVNAAAWIEKKYLD